MSLTFVSNCQRGKCDHMYGVFEEVAKYEIEVFVLSVLQCVIIIFGV